MATRPPRLASCEPHVLIAVASWFAIQVTPATGATSTTWWVTNQGLDSPSCGIRSKPCRSISAAIEKASDGDVIEVGAGLYGDLNGDGAFTAPGEEHFSTTRFGRTCIICISKSIKLLSLHGAEDTIIDAGNSRRPDPTSDVGRVDDVVNIGSSGVTLGAPAAGFTITGGGNRGVHVDTLPTDVKIVDNIARGNVGKPVCVVEQLGYGK